MHSYPNKMVFSTKITKIKKESAQINITTEVKLCIFKIYYEANGCISGERKWVSNSEIICLSFKNVW